MKVHPLSSPFLCLSRASASATSPEAQVWDCPRSSAGLSLVCEISHIGRTVA
jgi:hypothetical protein